MEKLTFYDINKILTSIADRKSSDFDLVMLLDSDITNLDKLKVEVNGAYHDQLDLLGEFEVISVNDSDREGYDTEQLYRVLYFKNHNIYIKVKGWWNSYSGDKFESMKEVRPITKTITVYE